MDRSIEEPLDAERLAGDELGASEILPALSSAAQAARSLIGLRLSTLEIVPGQDRLLLELEREGRTGLSAVASDLNIRPSTVSKMMDRLGEKGLTTRSLDPNDARRIFVELTDKGREVCRDIRAARQMSEDELRKLLGGDEAIHVAQTLVVLNEALTKQLRRHR